MEESGSSSVRISFRVTWNIKNFNYYTWDQKEAFRSPIFNSHSNLWQLWLRPLKKDEENFMNISFGRLSGSQDLILNYKLEILKCDSSAIIVNEINNWKVKTSDHIVIPIHVGKDENIDEWMKSVLSNDIFSIQCSVWNSDSPCFEKDPRFLTTTIGVEKKSFDWIIKDFASIELVCRRVMSIIRPSMALKLSCSNNCLQIDLSLKESCEKTYVECEISLATSKLSLHQKKRTLILPSENPKMVRLFPDFLPINSVLQNVFSPNGVLTLRCACSISNGIISELTTYGPPSLHHLDQQGSFNNQSMDSYKADMLRMYKDRTWCDFSLRTINGENFPVHRGILATRTPALKTLVGDESNRATETAIIPDISGDTLNRMLMYIYADTTENLDFEVAAKLFFVADKYQLQTLKRRCSEFLKMNLNSSGIQDVLDIATKHQDSELKGLCLSFLKSSLSLSNVCDVLVIADTYQDSELKTLAEDFVAHHDEDVLMSAQWNSLLEKRSFLAAQTLQKMYVKKVKFEPILTKKESC